MSKKITLLGSTGSIGTQSLDVIRAQGYEVFGLSAHSHVEKILEQIEEFHPRYVCMTDPDAAARLDAALAGRANPPAADRPRGPEGAGRHGRPRCGAEQCGGHRRSGCQPDRH